MKNFVLIFGHFISGLSEVPSHKLRIEKTSLIGSLIVAPDEFLIFRISEIQCCEVRKVEITSTTISNDPIELIFFMCICVMDPHLRKNIQKLGEKNLI